MPPSAPPPVLGSLESGTNSKIDFLAELLRRRYAITLKAWGTSMLPSLWPGDVLTIQSAANGELAAGDVVLILRENRFFVHRLVGLRMVEGRLLWVTRGDGMSHDDPPAAGCELLGSVTNVCRGNRNFVPSRQMSLPKSAIAWMLCRCGRFRSLVLRIHAIGQHAVLSRVTAFLREVFCATRRIPSSLARTSHP